MIRLAATVMLVRPAEHAPFEVFMLRRSEASHFVPDVYVFPGGTLDPSDLSEEAFARTKGIDESSLRLQFRVQAPPSLPAHADRPDDRECAGLTIAAVRELFEEAGVLLACDAGGRALPDRAFEPVRERLHAARAQVHSGRLQFHELLRELDVYANGAALALFSQWITPPVYPRRYNAHFFVAVADADQAATADTVETHDGIWIAPGDALERSSRGEFSMVYPTVKHLERLAQFRTSAALVDFARTKRIYTVMPKTPGEHQFSLPADLEYAW